jgi:hypothetical protein
MDAKMRTSALNIGKKPAVSVGIRLQRLDLRFDPLVSETICANRSLSRHGEAAADSSAVLLYSRPFVCIRGQKVFALLNK